MSRPALRLASAALAATAVGATLLVTGGVAHAAAGPTSLASGATLQPGQELDDAQYRLVMQGDGNLVEYVAGHAIWSTQTQGHDGAWAVMQGAGNLVVYPKGGGTALWANSGTGTSGSHLQLNPDGNVVIYAGSTPTWANGGRETTVYSGQVLTAGQFLQSPSRTYKFVMQGDGNLVLYRSDGTAAWASGTQGHDGAYAVMQTAGNLVVYPKGGGTALWANSGSGTSGAVAQVTDQGTVQIVSGATVSWTTSGTVPTTSLGAKIVNTAAAQSGYQETGNNCNRFSQYWGRGGGCEAWCADFAEWVWKTSGAETDAAITGSAVSFETWAKNHGRWHAAGSYTPQPGDAVVYGGDGHVGIVASSTNGLPNVINGNWADAVSGIVDQETNQYGSGSNDILGYATPYAA